MFYSMFFAILQYRFDKIAVILAKILVFQKIVVILYSKK